MPASTAAPAGAEPSSTEPSSTGPQAGGGALVVGVLALQGDVREHLRALAGCGVAARPVRRPDELDTVDALVIPGGESTTMSKLAVEFGVLDPVRKRIAGGLPAFGCCAGMIMLADQILDGRPDQRSFGGIEMSVRRNAFGRQVDSFEAPVRIAGVPGPPLPAVFIRAPWVERVGSGVEVLGQVTLGAAGRDAALGAAGGNAAPGAAGGDTAPGAAGGDALPGGAGGDPATGRIVAVRQRNLLATAFHPELTGDLRMHRLFVEMARRAVS